MSKVEEYEGLLSAKVRVAPKKGFAIDASRLHPSGKPHQKAIAEWAILQGAALLALECGLGKTHLAIDVSNTLNSYLGGKHLIVTELGAAETFVHPDPEIGEGARMGIALEYVTNSSEAFNSKCNIVVTNYERVRNGEFDFSLFTSVHLDEGNYIKNMASETTDELSRQLQKVKYKYIYTATPSPNETLEIINYCHVLGIADRGGLLTQFFQRNSTKAGELTLHPQHTADFWLFVSTWAIFITKPSDLGFDDEGYELPPLNVHWHEVKMEKAIEGKDKDGQKRMFTDAAGSLPDAAKIKRESIDVRLEKVLELINQNPTEHHVIWHHLEDERKEIEDKIPVRVYENWCEFKDGNSKALELCERHYSAYKYADGRERKLFVGPGEKMVLLTKQQDALFVWRKFIDDSGQKGINCAVFRNEGEILSSDLIKEAMYIAWQRWGYERLYTYVDADAIESNNPGYCFLKAGWNKCGLTKNFLIILEADLFIATGIITTNHFGSLYGSQDWTIREKRIVDFSKGNLQILATKPEISGVGCNFQKHCHTSIFMGINNSFDDFYQALRRIYRFGQKEAVDIHIVYTPEEYNIVKNLQEKWRLHHEQREKMRAIVLQYGLDQSAYIQERRRTFKQNRVVYAGDNFTLVNNDCVYEFMKLADDSMDMILTSIPFGNHYEYSDKYNDFGHNVTNDAFFKQMDYLVPELLRTLKPGRIAAFHTKNRIRYGSVTGLGFSVFERFTHKACECFERHGFQCMGFHFIPTDVVAENNQTHRLTFGEMQKDSTKMGAGIPEEIWIFRKAPSSNANAYADDSVQHNCECPYCGKREEYKQFKQTGSILLNCPKKLKGCGQYFPEEELKWNSEFQLSLPQWQIDADSFWRSSGNRLLTPEELQKWGMSNVRAWWNKFNSETIYDFDTHKELLDLLHEKNKLSKKFTTLPLRSNTPYVWNDVNRMHGLNLEQQKRKLQNHICPMPFDEVDRLIELYSNKGDVIADPFGGLGTTGIRAIKKKRKAFITELNDVYAKAANTYLKETEMKVNLPSLFDMLEMEVV